MAHVLLVDDYRPIRSAVTRYLRLHGHTVTEAANVRAALERSDERVDVVVTALAMPGRSGAELLRALRGRGTTVPVIMISGRFPAAEETVGAAFVLQRPFEPMALLHAVDHVLAPETGEAVTGAQTVPTTRRRCLPCGPASGAAPCEQRRREGSPSPGRRAKHGGKR